MANPPAQSADATLKDTIDDCKGSMHPCRNCGKMFFVEAYIEDMAEPKLCSKKCAKEWLGN
jgi:hypothetical protein